MSRCAWKSVPTAISGGVNILEVPRCQFLQQMSSQRGSEKVLQASVSHVDRNQSERQKPDNLKSHNSLKLTLTNI